MYYTHLGYQTSIFGKNCAYYIRIFTVHFISCAQHLVYGPSALTNARSTRAMCNLFSKNIFCRSITFFTSDGHLFVHIYMECQHLVKAVLRKAFILYCSAFSSLPFPRPLMPQLAKRPNQRYINCGTYDAHETLA